MIGDRSRVAAPQPHLMALQRKIASRGKRAISAAEYGNSHIVSSSRTQLLA
jgi:hypothetical protein